MQLDKSLDNYSFINAHFFCIFSGVIYNFVIYCSAIFGFPYVLLRRNKSVSRLFTSPPPISLDLGSDFTESVTIICRVFHGPCFPLVYTTVLVYDASLPCVPSIERQDEDFQSCLHYIILFRTDFKLRLFVS